MVVPSPLPTPHYSPSIINRNTPHHSLLNISLLVANKHAWLTGPADEGALLSSSEDIPITAQSGSKLR